MSRCPLCGHDSDEHRVEDFRLEHGVHVGVSCQKWMGTEEHGGYCECEFSAKVAT